MKKKSPPSPLALLTGKSEKKDEKNPSGKKAKWKRTIVDHHNDGSHTINHEPQEAGTENVSYSRSNLKGVIAGLKEHLAEEAAEGEK